MNSLLSKFLDRHFAPGFGKFLCHSFRAGLPSMMASNPNLFSKEETMEVGRWSSDAFLRYTRLYGLRAKTISNKLQLALQVHTCLSSRLTYMYMYNIFQALYCQKMHQQVQLTKLRSICMMRFITHLENKFFPITVLRNILLITYE